MAFYTYDSQADALYVLLVDEDDAVIASTDELSDVLHVDLDAAGRLVGVEFLSPRSRTPDTRLVNERYGVDIDLPFSFAA